MHNKLEVLRIGKNLFSIPHAGFCHNNLTRLILPENTQELQAEALSDNPITEIIFEGAPAFIHRHAFHLGTPEMAHVAIRGHLAKDLKTLLQHHAKHINEYRALSARDK
ncbi:leucine-rich repeat domain-containing protein [Gracilibacillus caseinilyticus]|uniref:Leucine-rich repeat domain-containing protein n=1 Tax=Gracilibacillus caseinilyticus TaxID=2932256 RepID=A0ABY4EYD6_9BACI|nr:leucine-rich repeat domain-containing protein [Gracilibacillus caseinilyticus]UOQ49420.1 leucine-rich repeat domain-containing protein [Gracilibacillus caseinilyticus]